MLRAEIRASILDGDIDKALKLTGAYYPSVLRENENIYFKLRCHKFIEMIRSCIELHSDMTGSKGYRRRSGAKVKRMKRRKESNIDKKSFDRARAGYGDERQEGEYAANGYANGDGNEAGTGSFAQQMEIDYEKSRDGYQQDYDSGAGNGHDDGNSTNWDRMDMEDGGSGDEGVSHGVSIVAATNGSDQRRKTKKTKDNISNESNGLADKHVNDIDDEEDEDISDSASDNDSDDGSSSDSADSDDEMDDDDEEEDDSYNNNDMNKKSMKRSQDKRIDKSTLQAKYNAMMQLTIQYGQELKSEFDGDPRREVKQALEETFALIAYPDARESMLAPLLDLGERVPVAEELNGAILGWFSYFFIFLSFCRFVYLSFHNFQLFASQPLSL